MIISLLKLIFGKIIGLDSIPKERRAMYWQELSDFSLELARRMSEGTAKGIVEGKRSG